VGARMLYPIGRTTNARYLNSRMFPPDMQEEAARRLADGEGK
jgi:hypothetical protein